MPEVIAVICTGRSKEELSRIGKKLVQEKLVACVNVLGPVTSHFRWQGKLCCAKEALMIAKTRRRLFKQVSERIRELHSYELPEILAFPVSAGLPQYLEWVIKETKNPGPQRRANK